MFSLSAVAARVRIVITRALAPIGFRDDSFLLVLAVLVGVLASIVAVTFHQLIVYLRELCYMTVDPGLMFGPAVLLLVAFPAIGGLLVGIINWLFQKEHGSHGIPDVIESIARGGGWMRPIVAIEKTLSAAITIGSGGSTGAEGPIVQIGSAVASGVGQMFRLARSQMPLIIGCGAAAGISSIFNAPIGGVLFVLEVILLDFSLKTFAPVVVASVIANVSTQFIFANWIHGKEGLSSIFYVPVMNKSVGWSELFFFLVLGVLCGFMAVCLTVVMRRCDAMFARMRSPRVLRPMIGGSLVGVMGVVYVAIFFWLGVQKPMPNALSKYPLPAFFSDGYQFVQILLGHDIYTSLGPLYLFSLLAFVLVAKIFATSVTLGSGGSGGMIAPALFVGAVTGALLGMTLKMIGLDVNPETYALIGMGAVLGAMVHAPLAAILILLELVRSYQVVLPSMLASVTAVGVARRMITDSIYTFSLRQRGVQFGGHGDQVALRQLYVEQVTLEPASVVQPNDSLQRVLELATKMKVENFVVIDRQGYYIGMLLEEDVAIALAQREAAPLLIVDELMRSDVPFIRNSDNLSTVVELMNQKDMELLPVCLEQSPGKVIGLVTRSALMRTYQAKLAG